MLRQLKMLLLSVKPQTSPPSRWCLLLAVHETEWSLRDAKSEAPSAGSRSAKPWPRPFQFWSFQLNVLPTKYSIGAIFVPLQPDFADPCWPHNAMNVLVVLFLPHVFGNFMVCPHQSVAVKQDVLPQRLLLAWHADFRPQSTVSKGFASTFHVTFAHLQ